MLSPPPSRTSRPRTPLVTISLALAAGIALDAWLPGNPQISFGLAATSLVVWFLLRRAKQDRAALLVLLIALVATGTLHHHNSGKFVLSEDVLHLTGRQKRLVRLTGIITSAPRLRPSASIHDAGRPTTLLDLRCTCYDAGPQLSHRKTRIRGHLQLVVRGRALHLQVGDRIEVTGWLQKPRGTRNPGDIDFRTVLTRRGIHAFLFVNSPEAISHQGRSRNFSDRFQRLRAQLRNRGRHLLRTRLSSHNADVAAALLLGFRDGLGKEQRQVFTKSGTRHLLAISGLHVGLLASLLWSASRLINPGRFLTSLIVIGGVLLYAMITEGRPSVIRATILVTAAMLGRPWHRQTTAANTLGLAAILLLAWNPADLFDTGAQLSFVAVATLLWTTRRVIRRSTNGNPTKHGPSWWHRCLGSLWQAWQVSVVIWLVTAPLVATRFGLVAPMGLLVNVLMIPVVAVCLWLGFALLLVGSWVIPLGIVLGDCMELVLTVLLWVVHLAGETPLASQTTPAPAESWLCGFYLLVAAVALTRIPSVRSRWLVALTGYLLLGLLAGFSRGRDNPLRLTVLDVGHGGAILVECPNGKTLLYDAGTVRGGHHAADIIRRALWQHRRRRLDAIVISHADQDHFNGAQQLLQNLPVGTLVLAHSFLDPGQPETMRLADTADDRSIDVQLVQAGDRLQLDRQVEIRVLHPTINWRGSTDNSNSLVLEVLISGRRILLTGDIELEGLERLMKLPARSVDILLAPHHGSPVANPRRLAGWARPHWVLASGSRQTIPAVLGRHYSPSTRIVSTREAGAITVEIDSAGRLRITTGIRPALPD